jgi:hypothetical protein
MSSKSGGQLRNSSLVFRTILIPKFSKSWLTACLIMTFYKSLHRQRQSHTALFQLALLAGTRLPHRITLLRRARDWSDLNKQYPYSSSCIYIYTQSLQWVCSSPRPFKGQQYRRFTAVPVPTLHICFRWTGLRRIMRACKGAVLLEVSAQALCREMMRVLSQRSQGTGTMREQWLLLLPLHQSILLFKDIEAALRAEPQKVRS